MNQMTEQKETVRYFSLKQLQAAHLVGSPCNSTQIINIGGVLRPSFYLIKEADISNQDNSIKGVFIGLHIRDMQKMTPDQISEDEEKIFQKFIKANPSEIVRKFNVV